MLTSSSRSLGAAWDYSICDWASSYPVGSITYSDRATMKPLLPIEHCFIFLSRSSCWTQKVFLVSVSPRPSSPLALTPITQACWLSLSMTMAIVGPRATLSTWKEFTRSATFMQRLYLTLLSCKIPQR
jgi:hypothetical protein